MRKGKNKWNPFKKIFKKNSTFPPPSSVKDKPEPEVEQIFEIEPTPKEYKILGLDDNVTNKEIKERYRYLIKQYHPDNGGDSKEFIKIQKAYEKIMKSRTTK